MNGRSSPRLTAFIAALIVALVGCSAPAEPSPSGGDARPSTLAGTSWRVVSVAGRAPIAGAVPTAMFDVDRVTGSGGCNSYGGSYRYDPASGRIELGEVQATAMACLEAPRNDFETSYFQALGQVNLASLDGQARLVLSGPQGVIVLERDPQRAVEG